MGVAKRTAHRDLSDLVEKGLFMMIGTRGKGAFYRLQAMGHKGANGATEPRKGDK
jgi:hypothetical protein